MNLDIIACSFPQAPACHFSTISRHPVFEVNDNFKLRETKINSRLVYSHLMSTLYYNERCFLKCSVFSHICLIMARLLKRSCHKTGPLLLLRGERLQTLALIRHLRVIRLNTAFTLHFAHSSRSAPAQRKCTVGTRTSQQHNRSDCV